MRMMSTNGLARSMLNRSASQSYDQSMKAWAALMLLSVCAAAPQSQPAAPERSSAAILAEALRTLTDEAKQSLIKHQLARPAANFAGDFKQQLPPQLIGQKIARQLHSDPFIDAYMRWQLTSFKGAALPGDLTERQYQKFIDELPVLIQNPRADRELIDALIAKARLGPLSDPQQGEINAKLNDLSERTSQADAMNQAPLLFRAWVRDQASNSPMRTALADLERCAALVQAGWPSDEWKTKLEQSLTEHARDHSFAAAQRQFVIDHMRLLISKKNLYITSATVRDGAVAVEYGDTGIYDFDVRKWSRILLQQ